MSLQKMVEFEGKKHVLRVLYKNNTMRDIPFDSTEELQKNLNIDCTKLKRAIVYGFRATPFNPGDSSQALWGGGVYKESWKYEKQLKKWQSKYKFRMKENPVEEKQVSPGDVTTNENPAERHAASPLEKTVEKPFIYQMPSYDGKSIRFVEDLMYTFDTVNGFLLGSEKTKRYFATRLQPSGKLQKQHIVSLPNGNYVIQLRPWINVIAAAEKVQANLITSGKGTRELRGQYFFFTYDLPKIEMALTQRIAPYLIDQIKNRDIDVETGKVRE